MTRGHPSSGLCLSDELRTFGKQAGKKSKMDGHETEKKGGKEGKKKVTVLGKS